MSEVKPDQDPAVLRELTALYYSDRIGVLVKKLLATDDRAVASHAAYLIGLHGSAEDPTGAGSATKEVAGGVEQPSGGSGRATPGPNRARNHLGVGK
ncbi:MAG TPA: hypothetical protein VFY51_02860 [Pyrinomonadaceae bacterium]|nr:hypothetical protein [Pyrinomonadaceae bacterium]